MGSIRLPFKCMAVVFACMASLTSASALSETTYSLEFYDPYTEWGSGTATFTDTTAPDGGGWYAATGVTGNALTQWLYAAFLYDPAGGGAQFALLTDPHSSIGIVGTAVGSGFLPLEGLEQLFTVLEESKSLVWSKTSVAVPVPEGGATVALLALGILAAGATWQGFPGTRPGAVHEDQKENH